ncbi:MAG: oligoribonuclease [Dermatophilus congolensis]|nr:oligoribonuclease [Dermatophilus congolensis]
MSSTSNRLASDRIVWIDCEMTGLSLEHDALIEVAVIVTDFDLQPLDDGMEVVITPPREALRQMNDFVRQMHTDSGLLEILDEGLSMEEAQALVLGYVKKHAPEAGKFPLGGNTVGTDRAFLARDMPDLEGHLHYRNVDVSTVKELARRWYPRVYFNAPAKHGGHRALGDIRDSIAELRYYREAVFVEAPGPDSAGAKEIASRHGVTVSAEHD